MRLLFLFALACTVAGTAGCKNPTAAEDVNARMIAEVHALADHLEAGRTEPARASVRTLRGLTAKAKTLRLAPSQDAALQKQFAAALDAATARLRTAAAAGKLTAAELQSLAD